jgi:hypothetical protein
MFSLKFTVSWLLQPGIIPNTYVRWIIEKKHKTHSAYKNISSVNFKKTG